MKHKKRKKSKRFTRLFGGTTIFSIGLSVFLQIKYPHIMDAYQEFGIRNASLCIVLVTLSHIFLHETAHVIGGLLTGYRILAMGIWQFQLTFLNGKIELNRYSVPGAAGYCFMVPPESKNGKYPFVLSILGGCLMNLILAIIFGIMLLLKNRSFGFYFFCFSMALFGVASSVTNLIPKSILGLSTDGQKFFSMMKSEKERSAFYTLSKITEAMFYGIRLKDMPDAWFFIPSDEEMKNHLISGIGLNAVSRMQDEGKIEEADHLLAHFLSIPTGITSTQRFELICCRLCTEILGENRPEKIAKFYTDDLIAYLKKAKNTLIALQTQYIYSLLVERNQKKSEQTLAKFEKIAKRYPFPQSVETCRRLFTQIREKADREAANHG